MALGILLRQFQGDPLDVSVSLGESSQFISELYQERGPLDFTDSEVIRALINKSALSSYDDPIEGWICDIVANYFKAIPPTITESDQMRAWILTFRFIIVGHIKGLNYMQNNLDQFHLTPEEIVQWKNYFENSPSLVPNQFLAITDYIDIYPQDGSTIRINSCNPTYKRLPTCNDSPFSAGFSYYHSDPPSNLKSAVFEDQTKIRAKMVSNREIFVEKQAQFNGQAPFYGMTYFDYTVEQDGVQGNGRTYVYFWPEIMP